MGEQQFCKAKLRPALAPHRLKKEEFAAEGTGKRGEFLFFACTACGASGFFLRRFSLFFCRFDDEQEQEEF
jgi:hypothetical protein